MGRNVRDEDEKTRVMGRLMQNAHGEVDIQHAKGQKTKKIDVITGRVQKV
jgi:hypothetical protein